jgi:hypothetical protein
VVSLAWETHSTCGLVGFPAKKTTRVIFPLKKHTRAFSYYSNGIDVFSSDALFQGIDTFYLQKQFFANECGLVEPKCVVLGTKLKWQKDGTLREVQNIGYFVDILQQLQALLNDPFVLSEVENPHFSNDGCIADVMDGNFFKTHPVFSVHVKGLQILAYYDDLEVTNVVGSSAKKHKVGVFF